MSVSRNWTSKKSTNLVLLSSLALPQQKVMLVNDKTNIISQSKELVQLWLTEQTGGNVELCTVTELTESSPFLFMPICKLERRFEPAQLFQFVSQCKRNTTVAHLCLWLSDRKLRSSFLLPYLEHMADTVITLEDNAHLALLVKKSSGAVSSKYYEFKVPDSTNSVYVTETMHPEAKARLTAAAPAAVEPPPNPATLGTFKIDLKEEEIKAKNALTLPFEFYKTTPEGGKILYHPDAEDDLDEEDPDDDLLI